jgi:hypothetical protein
MLKAQGNEADYSPLRLLGMVLNSLSTGTLPLTFICPEYQQDRLYGLVVRVAGHRSRGSGFDSRCYQIFCEATGMERGPLGLIRLQVVVSRSV